jgi:hypothetical protein
VKNPIQNIHSAALAVAKYQKAFDIVGGRVVKAMSSLDKANNIYRM